MVVLMREETELVYIAFIGYYQPSIKSVPDPGFRSFTNIVSGRLIGLIASGENGSIKYKRVYSRLRRPPMAAQRLLQYPQGSMAAILFRCLAPGETGKGAWFLRQQSRSHSPFR